MSQRNKYANSNLNGVLSSQKAGSGYSQPYSQPTRYGSGLVSLGSAKARLPASNSASKLAVPKPVNLPSLRKENAGNDPNTQIVPSGSGASWQKVEEPAPTPADLRQTALSAGSTWASTQSRDSGWQPPAPQLQALPPPRPGSRRLNPHEYPSLSAAATPRQLNLPKQRVPSVPDSQGVANWDEDERRLPVAGPGQPAPPERVEDERGFRPPWEDRGDTYGGRGPADGYATRGLDEDRVAQDLEKERQRKLEQEVVVVEEEPVPKVAEPAPPVKEPSGPLTLAQVAAANVTEAPQNSKLARRQRELEEEEAERKRKEAAAAKLKALDEAIAAREAERHALEELAAKDAAEKRAEEEAKAARAAAEAAAIAHEKAETELAALTLQEEEQEAAALPARPALGSVSERAATDQEPEGSVHGSSVDVQANSSVAQDALSDDDRDDKLQPAPEVEAVPVIATVPPGLGWDAIAEPPGLGGWSTSAAGSLPIISSAESTLPLAADSRSSRFAPSLDPIAIKSPIAESSDPPVERPKSAAGVVGAVSRPRSASTAAAAGSLGQDVLPNGIPALPADLSLDALPAPLESHTSGFSGQRPSAVSNAPSGAAAFPGVLFSLPSQPQGANMWQQFGQPQTSGAQQGGTPQQQGMQDQAAFNLSAAKQSFYNAGGDQSFGSGISYGGGSGGISSNPQFGAFSNTQFGQGVPPGLQFGQLHTGFGAPFVPTGKQADWSTGAASKQPDWSTGPLGKQPDWSVGPLGTNSQAAGPQTFTRPGNLESVVRHVPFPSQQPPSDSLSRSGGLPQSNGNMEMHRQAMPEGVVGKAGETSAAVHDTAAGLPDDVFTPEDIRSSVEPAVPVRGGPSAGGGRRGGRGRMGSPPMRGVPAGRAGYGGRGRGREAGMDGVPAGNDGGNHQHQRRREGGPPAGQQQRVPQARRHPGEGVPPPQDGSGRDGARGRGAGRARGARGGARGGQTNPVTAWVPLPQGA
ncbi:hypothetical protein WJX75_001307 [Coccomyxa subellipsoidea]|uniref:BAT2 N-terminal domain-containing protein n=1 Tax=Coccomyxa subellipsoidea TaxID=248742 RepID=A0ABR2YXC6_9CHLO